MKIKITYSFGEEQMASQIESFIGGICPGIKRHEYQEERQYKRIHLATRQCKSAYTADESPVAYRKNV